MVKNGGFSLFLHRCAPDLIRLRFQSRHKGSTKYFTWVQFSPSTEACSGSITGWYCQCKAGRRVVGCCAHVATAIWFLAFARHEEGGYQPSPTLDKFWKGVLDSGAGFEDSDEEEPAEEVLKKRKRKGLESSRIKKKS